VNLHFGVILNVTCVLTVQKLSKKFCNHYICIYCFIFLYVVFTYKVKSDRKMHEESVILAATLWIL